MIVRWHLETGFVGGDLSGELEVDDDADDIEIERDVKEDMWNFLSLTWSKEMT